MPPVPPAAVCVGAIVGAHGVKGAVKVKSFTEEPAAFAAYGPLDDNQGRTFRARVIGRSGEVLVATLEGVADRTAAEALKGVRLYVSRAALPEAEEEEYYHADLIGLRVETLAGENIGTVAALFDFGAGDLIEVKGKDGGSRLISFTKRSVPMVDVAGGRLVVDPLAEMEDDEEEKEQAKAGATRDRKTEQP